MNKHFPKSHKLHKIFNRNNLKVSYSCTTNMANIIKSHNQKILNECNETSSENKCNRRNKNLCPLDGACLISNIIYEATVTTTSGNSRSYIGMTDNEFRTRFNDKKHSHDTVLSKHNWDLKDKNINYTINWRIIKRAKAYKGNPSRCNLCLSEKLCILSARNAFLLNKKSELVTKCQSLEASLQPFLNLNTYIRRLLVDNDQSDDRLERETRVTSNTFLLTFVFCSANSCIEHSKDK